MKNIRKNLKLRMDFLFNFTSSTVTHSFTRTSQLGVIVYGGGSAFSFSTVNALVDFNLFIILIGNDVDVDEDELGLVACVDNSLLILKALFVAPFTGGVAGRKILLFGCDTFSSAFGFNLIASS